MAPKYQRVAEGLLDSIRDGEYVPGDALPAEVKLADRYGVSRITVRRAIEELEEEGRIQRRPGRGAFVQESTPEKNLLYVGPSDDDFFQPFLSSLRRLAQKQGRNLGMFSTDHHRESLEQSDHLQELVEDAGAVICITSCRPVVEGLLPGDRAVVEVTGWQGDADHAQNGRAGYVISTNTFLAGRMATEHLLSLDHAQIAYFGSGRRGLAVDQSLWRPRPNAPAYQGYRIAMQNAGVNAPPGIGFPEDRWDGEDDDWQSIHEETMRRYVERDGWPTAIVCEGDFRAAPVLRVAMEEGLSVPDDLSVIGMCNTPWSQMLAPDLTSVDLQQKEMARLAISLIDEPMPDETKVYRIDPQMIERRSTAKHAAQREICAV